jgi:GTP-binding protein
LVNGQEGLTGIDEQICDMLRKSKPHVILAVNKIDDFSKHSWDEFYQLGFEIIPISAEHGKNISDLMDEVAKNIPESGMDSFFDGIKVSLAGRPNAGKSSLFNKICGENRSIVSDIPHTTRDAIDTVIEYSGKKYKFVDTAGVRKKNKVNTKIERYSIIRSLRSIENSDVVLLLIDAELGIEEQDMRIANLALSNKKGLIIVINKWDLIEKDDKTYKKFLDDINNNAKFLSFVPVMFISALTGQRVHKIFENIDKVYANLRMKIPTSKLNDLIAEIKESYNMPSYKGNKLKLNFMTQINVDYPLFVIHTTRKELITPSFEKFLINRLRKKFDFSGVPIFINFKTKIKK